MPNADYTIVTTPDDLEEVIDQINKADLIALDLETSGFDPKINYIVGISLSVREAQSYYIPVGHRIGEQLEADYVWQKLKQPLEEVTRVAIFNAKFDTKFLEVVDIDIPWASIDDPMLELFSAGENALRYNLKDSVQRIYNHSMVKFNELFPRGTATKNIGNLRVDVVAPYACEDADFTRRLDTRTYGRVGQSFIYKLERQLWPYVRRIEEAGLLVDLDFVEKVATNIGREAEILEESIYDQVDTILGQKTSFKLSSPKDLAEILFNQMGLPILTKTDSGKPATSELALSALKDKYPVVSNILALRSMKANVKILSETLMRFVREDGRVHTQYNQAGASSGRFASSEPNMQNQAKVKSWKITNTDGSSRDVVIYPRDAFIAGPENYLIELDFKAIEFLIMAAEAGEDSIVRAYEQGIDSHINTASAVLAKPLEAVTKEERQQAKVWNYLIIYGGSGYRLSKETGQDEAKSQADIDRFYQTYPKLLQYANQVKDKARITRKVSTHFGRWQVVPEYFMSGARSASKAERASVNRIIQGTAADIHKMGIVRAFKRLDREYTFEQAHMVAQTHDSQTWEVHQSIPPSEIIPIIKEAMSPVIPNYPRVAVDAQVGIAWGSMEDYDEDATYDWDRMRDVRTKRIAEMGIVQSVFASSSRSDSSNGLVVAIPASTDQTLVKDLISIIDAYAGDNPIQCEFQDGDEIQLQSNSTSLTKDTIMELLGSRIAGLSVREQAPELENASIAV